MSFVAVFDGDAEEEIVSKQFEGLEPPFSDLIKILRAARQGRPRKKNASFFGGFGTIGGRCSTCVNFFLLVFWCFSCGIPSQGWCGEQRMQHCATNIMTLVHLRSGECLSNDTEYFPPLSTLFLRKKYFEVENYGQDITFRCFFFRH